MYERVKILKRIFFITLAILALSAAAFSQPQHTSSAYGNENGFTSALIEDITQDDYGYLWIASRAGLFKFDGLNFNNYSVNRLDINGKPRGNRLLQVEYDSFGEIWVLSYTDAVYRFDREAETFTPINAKGPKIKQIFKLSADDLLFLSDDNALLKLKRDERGEGFGLEPYFNIHGSEIVNGCIRDADHNIWIITDQRIYCNKEVFRTSPAYCAEQIGESIYFGSAEGLIIEANKGRQTILQTKLSGNVDMLASDSEGTGIVAGSTKEGLTFYGLRDNDNHDIAGHVYIDGKLDYVKDGKGNLWIYSPLGGLYWYDEAAFALVPFAVGSSGLEWNSENNIMTVFVDRQDDLWIGPSLGGLEKVIPNLDEFKLRTIGDTLEINPENSVRAIFQDNDGAIFAATKDGRVHLLDSRLRELSSWEAPSPVYDITQSRDGDIWLATKGSGLIQLRSRLFRIDGRPTLFGKDDGRYGQPGELLYYLLEDERHRLWISSFDEGLYYLDLKSKDRQFVSRRNELIGLPEDMGRMRCITIGPDGKLYAGGTRGILVCGNPDKVPEKMTFSIYSKIPNYDVQNILFTNSGEMYAGTFGNGFLRFDDHGSDSGFRAYTTTDGLLSNFIFNAVEDASGNIWLATGGGLNRLNPATGSIISYSYERLGFNMRFNEGAPLLDNAGILYFNTNAGILYFDPDRISNSNFVPKLMITACYIAGEKIHPADDETIRLGHGDKLSIYYAAIDMTAPEQVLYSYKLEGRDEQWIRLGNQQNIIIGNLKKGEYTLRLKSTNGDGLAVDNEQTLKIKVRPPFYASIWAFLILAGLVGSISGGLILLNKRRLELHRKEDLPFSRLSGEDKIFAETLHEYLLENLDNGNLDISDMAAKMSLSRSAFFEKCKTLLKKTPTGYLLDLRFAKAAELISNGGYQISQIAFMTGFNDPHYFSKAFKKQFGVSPSQYRKQV